MRNFLCLLLIVTAIYGCFPEKVRIIADKRISVTGKILNAIQPVLNVPVVAYGVFRNYVDEQPPHRLGFGKTSSSGNFNFISLDTRNGDLSVSINPSRENSFIDEYATLHFLDLEGDRDTFLHLGDVRLPKKVNFIIEIQNSSGTQEELRYSFTYKNRELYYLIDEGSLVEDEEYYSVMNYRRGGDTHPPGEENREEVLHTVEDSEILFTYRVGEENAREISISVTNSVNNYLFEY